MCEKYAVNMIRGKWLTKVSSPQAPTRHPPGKPHPTPKENTARKLPVWLSGKPGGKRKNPF